MNPDVRLLICLCLPLGLIVSARCYSCIRDLFGFTSVPVDVMYFRNICKDQKVHRDTYRLQLQMIIEILLEFDLNVSIGSVNVLTHLERTRQSII